MSKHRMAGQIALGAGAGAAGLLLAQYLAEQATPEHARRMTQGGHARNNIGGFREKFTKVTPEEMALYEGIRQGLMAGEISGEEVNMLAAQGRLPDRVMALLNDVHDWSVAGPAIPMERLSADVGYLAQGAGS